MQHGVVSRLLPQYQQTAAQFTQKELKECSLSWRMHPKSLHSTHKLSKSKPKTELHKEAIRYESMCTIYVHTIAYKCIQNMLSADILCMSDALCSLDT